MEGQLHWGTTTAVNRNAFKVVATDEPGSGGARLCATGPTTERQQRVAHPRQRGRRHGILTKSSSDRKPVGVKVTTAPTTAQAFTLGVTLLWMARRHNADFMPAWCDDRGAWTPYISIGEHGYPDKHPAKARRNGSC